MKYFNEDFWLYNIKTSSWKQQKTKNDIPKLVADSTSWLSENRMFLFGGKGNEGLSNDVHSLDLDTWEWTQHTTSGNKPSARFSHVLWTIVNNVVVFGGYGSAGHTTDTFHLNTTTMKWTELSTTGSPPSKRAWCAHAQYAGKGFLFGGDDDRSAYNDLHMFDLTSHVWTKLQPTSGSLPPERRNSRMIVRDMDLLIYGGNDDNKVFQDCWAWNLEKKVWRELKDHKFDGRCLHTACYMSDDDSVFIFGGYNTDRKTIGSLGRVSFP